MRGGNSNGHFVLALAFLIALPLCAPAARAATSSFPHGTVELIAENQWIASGHPFHVALHFQLEKGWHIYWVNPGDSGQPPTITWQVDPAFRPGAIQWPVPRRLGASSIVDFGYEDDVTLLVTMQAETGLQAHAPAQLRADIKVLVCREICIPGKTSVSLSLPIKSQQPAPDTRARPLFAAARKDLPRIVPRNWKFSVNESKDSFVLDANPGPQVAYANFFPLEEAQIDNSAPQNLRARSTGFRLTLRKSDRLLTPIGRLKGVLVLSGNRAYLIDVPVTKAGI